MLEMDLWSEFDNNLQLPPEQAVHGRARRLTERAILSLVRQWLLEDYVPAYTRSLAESRIFKRCYWIDGLGLDARSTKVVEPVASVAENGDGARKKRQAKPVSPVAPALQPLLVLANELAREKKPISLNALLLDGTSRRRRGPENPEAGQGKEFSLPRESAIIRSNWQEAGAQVLQEIQQSPAIFLLNPFGNALFSSEEMVLLYQRTVPTELCFLISHKQLEQHLKTASHNPELAGRLTGLLRSDRWKTLSTNDEELAASLEKILLLFTASMQRHFQLPVQRIMLPLQVWPAYVEAVPYTLIFATRRPDSFLCMNDAVCLHRRRLYKQSQRGVLGEEWFIQQSRQRQSEEHGLFYQRLLQQGRAQRTRSWPDLRQQVLLANFGQYTCQDYNHIIVELLAAGELRCEWRQRTNDETTRVPGEEDRLIWR